MKVFHTRRNLISDNRNESQSVSPISEEMLFIIFGIFNNKKNVCHPSLCYFLGIFLFVSLTVCCAYMIFTLII